jgi:hypothetical protein
LWLWRFLRLFFYFNWLFGATGLTSTGFATGFGLGLTTAFTFGAGVLTTDFFTALTAFLVLVAEALEATIFFATAFFTGLAIFLTTFFYFGG